MSDTVRKNALAGETSPYLTQHAENPVDWYPWSQASLERARSENKPILLSIGYSACHWCHVMAHESFEDEETARIMNTHFVNIKVDREERPDIDKIYQLAHQLLTRRPGGWPLTMFLGPEDHVPFFGGTYFPDEPRFGMPAFKEVLLRVVEFLDSNRADVQRHNAALMEALARSDGYAAKGAPRLTAAPLDRALGSIADSFDRVHGGFGSAPKFPHPSQLAWLLNRIGGEPGPGGGAEMALETLRKMGRGGIRDHVGGGFCRYSVDEHWMIPHFEKMLYDNGPLLGLYAQAFQRTRDPRFRGIAEEIAGWVMREMQSPEGGYYSSLDADSQGEEGRFYVWRPQQVETLLTAEEYRVVARRFGLDRPANFEGREWHLHVFRDGDDLERDLGLGRDAIDRRWASARRKLFEAREPRVHPGRDEKVLGAWNGLMITGMATAGRILGRPDLVASAERALGFVRTALWRDGRLLATCKDGRAHLDAYLDDYAFLLDAILSLLQIRWSASDMTFGIALADVMLARFEDPEGGGFFFTADDHEVLIHRSKTTMDEALPAGNGVAALTLARLGHLLGEMRYLDAARRTLEAAWPMIEEVPHAHSTLLAALEETLVPPQTIVLRGESGALARWRERCQAAFAPHRLTIAIPAGAEPLPGLLAEREPRGTAVAYVCEGHRCEAPITALTELEAVIGTES